MSDQQTPRYPLYHLPPQALATVILALGQYAQRRAELEKQTNFPAHTFCETPFGNIAGMYEAETNELIKSLQHTGLTFGQIVPMFAELAQHSPYVAAAQRMAREGEIEVDEPAVVSKGDDDGAYVMAWMWVSNHAAGIDIENEPEDGQ